MTTDKPVYAFMIEPTTRFDTLFIRAHIVRVMDDGEFRNPGYDYGYADDHFNDFAVSAYINKDDARIYGMFAEYREPFSVDLKRAEGMVKHLRKVTRGMDKLNENDGYVNENDYATYLLRVARIIGIKSFYVRNDREARERSGERWRKVTASGMQYYADTVRANLAAGKVSAYDN